MPLVLRDWNVVATVDPERFGPAKFDLMQLGRVGETNFPGVVVMRVPGIDEFLGQLEHHLTGTSNFFEAVRTVRPVYRHFTFETPESFRSRIVEMVLQAAPSLQGRSFDARVTLRGVTEELDAESMRRDLREAICERLEDEGERAVVETERADVVLDVESVERSGGLALWSRAEIERYPFLGFDGLEGTETR